MRTTPLLADSPLVAAATSTPEALLEVDLLEDLDRLVTHLRHELAGRSWLNAYLLAAGMNQVAEDHLNADGYLLGKAADHIATATAPLGDFGEQTLRAADSARIALHSLAPAQRHIVAWQADVASLVDRLAKVVITGESNEGELRATELLGQRVVGGCGSLPLALRRAVIRLPSCFRSFDQRPEDMERLVRKLTRQGVATATPIAAVGVRTSGSYLGPIVAASHRKEGFQDIVALTLRPGRPLPARDRATPRDVARRGGLVLLVDDPPTTGNSLDRAASEITRSGFAPAAIVMLVPLLGTEDSLPAKIRRHRHVLLPWEEWSIHDQMTSENVGASLSRVLGPLLAVADVERLSAPPRSGERGHVEGRILIRLRGLHDGVESQRMVHVASVGLGYFGEHSLAVAKRLTGLVPEVYGLHKGLLFRSWLPAERRLVPDGAAANSERLRPFLNYVRARAAALAVAQDISQRLRGRLPAWEAASNVSAEPSGAAGRGPGSLSSIPSSSAFSRSTIPPWWMGWVPRDRPTGLSAGTRWPGEAALLKASTASACVIAPAAVRFGHGAAPRVGTRWRNINDCRAARAWGMSFPCLPGGWRGLRAFYGRPCVPDRNRRWIST